MRFFNTAGPCNPDFHYMLPATERLAGENLQQLIAQQSYFILHAPRQTGKTTAMLELARQLTASGNYAALLVTMEVGAAFPDDIDAAEQAILGSWRDDIAFQLPAELAPPVWEEAPAGQRIAAALSLWARSIPRPLVIFIDEIDALQNDVLISVLRQLRAGHRRRPTAFPASVALIGLRDVRDYKVASGGSERLNTPSPFNVAVRSFTLRNFNFQEIAELLQQHTVESGQSFALPAQQAIYDLTQGQPWLVNALSKVCVEELMLDRAQPITSETVQRAKEILIQRRQTHLGHLTERLREPRVRRVIEPILAGTLLGDLSEDDREYCIDLGLVRRSNGGSLAIANPIYQEIIPRALSSSTQDTLPAIKPIWLTGDGQLDTTRLLDAFLTFWRQHGQPLLLSAPYHEIAPHLVLMAFLDRVVNGGGTVDREYAVGSDKMDLLVRHRSPRLAIELKVWRRGRPDPLSQGLQQLDNYLRGLSLPTGWLIIFDQRDNLPALSERTTSESATTPSGRVVTVIRA